jgi:hypothetical protein
MARPDGRIEKGQRLSSAISARAWNRAQEAADRVLGAGTGQEAGALNSFYLPSVRVTLRDKGWFGQCRFAKASTSGRGLATTGSPTNQTLGSLPDEQKNLINLFFPATYLSGSGDIQEHTGLFVCVGNDSNQYAMSGFAITRVRVMNYDHRYARSPVAFVGQTQEQANEVAGSLDSAFWGPAKIVGYCTAAFINNFFAAHDNVNNLQYPSYEFRWALIQF